MGAAAIQVTTEAYDASVPRPMGRHSAGEGFLRGYLRHADSDRLVLRNAADEDPTGLEALIDRLGRPSRPLTWLNRADRAGLAAAGALHLPYPGLGGEAWARRAFGGHAWSLTGVTHTLAETQVMRELGDLLLAPLEPWDALVCTSNAGRKAVESLLEGVAEYLAARHGAARIPPVQLVTIPLGVHAEDFRCDPQARHAWRERLDVPQDAPAALHLGRFSLTTKAHPGPMGLALQEAARRLGRTVYWILFGGGRRPEEESDFLRAASALCPDVEIRLAGDTSAATRDAIVSAADVFFALSDNVQETFGLAPVEAMAAGLPCVVSDWDGYRDTVRHGIDGFRIRTTAPRPGLGGDLAHAYASRFIGYDTYAGAAAMFAAPDVGEAGEALATLFADPDLRARMGDAAAARAREVFDWRIVIPQYQALWGELERRRAAAPPQAPLENPFAPDPFRMFAAWPSWALADEDVVALARPFGLEELSARLSAPFVRTPAARLPTNDEVEVLVARLAARPLTVAELLAAVPPERRALHERGLVWLLKFGLLRLLGAGPRT
jgi:glycosyltransferase involved in cell wall biosynthesis